MKELQPVINEETGEVYGELFPVSSLRECNFKDENQERIVFLRAVKDGIENGSLVASEENNCYLIAPQNDPEKGTAYFLQHGEENASYLSAKDVEELANFGDVRGVVDDGLFGKYRKEIDEMIKKAEDTEG